MKQFNRVKNVHPRRSVFDLSYTKLFDADMGILYPVMCDEVVPGDFFKIGNQMVIRFQPMVAPILHEVNAYVHYFFVPYRLLWNDDTNEQLAETGSWEEFITGGYDGEDASILPRWDPTGTPAEGSLWDLLGFPPGIADYTGALPIDFPRRAYNFIYSEYYRDETQESTPSSLINEALRKRRWEKDYFTSALPWQQRGTAPALPISGTTNAEFDSMIIATGSSSSALSVYNGGVDPTMYLSNYNTTARDNLRNVLSNGNVVDFANATTFDIADLRLAFQIQKWMERNARSGVRYTEFLKAHFGVSPRDDRLDRPEYIGGSKVPIIFSEVLQTSESNTTAQGNLAGHGISVSSNYCGKYHAQEYGLIMGLLSVMPKPVYQQGIDRQWLRESRYDFFFPEFVNLSEQAILNRELYVTDGNETENETIFGYQGRYDEMRCKRNMICGQMRSTFDYWHISRQFTSAPDLNSSFQACNPRKDFLAATTEPAMIVHFGNMIKAFRPLPIIAEPGLIDHN